MKVKAFFVVSLALWTLVSMQAGAQRLQISNYSIGSRIFEIQSISGSPFTVSRFLKQPGTYNQYLSNIQYSGFTGGRPIYRLPTYYIAAELSKPSSASPFWRKNTILVGLSLSNKLVNDNMSLLSQQFTELADGTFLSNINTYSVTHTQRFVGATVGFNRRLPIIKRLQFFTGLHTQGSIAVVHKFEQKWDSTTIISETGQAAKLQTKTSQLFDLKGKNFFQWQAMIPLGLELEVYQKQLFVRLEADFGLVGSAFHPSDFASREMHGVGLWLLYKLP